VNKLKEEKTYSAFGLVLGNCWGGGEGSYPSEKLYNDNLDVLKCLINKGIKNGTLDSGFGFKSLIGAIMIIETERKIIVNNRAYRNTTTKRYYTDGLTPKQKWFLSTCLNNR